MALNDLFSKDWPVLIHMKTELDVFLATLMVANLLRDPSLRSYEWETLSNELGVELYPESNDLTLEKLIHVKLHLLFDFVKNLAS